MNITGIKGLPESLLGVLVLAALSLTLTLAAPETRSEANTTSDIVRTPDTSPSNPERATTQEVGVDAQPSVAPKPTPTQEPDKKPLLSFFLIGVVINLIMLFAVGIWAYREWQKRS